MLNFIHINCFESFRCEKRATIAYQLVITLFSASHIYISISCNLISYIISIKNIILKRAAIAVKQAYPLFIICIRLKKANLAVAVAHFLHSRLRPGKKPALHTSSFSLFSWSKVPLYENLANKSASTIEEKQDDN